MKLLFNQRVTEVANHRIYIQEVGGASVCISRQALNAFSGSICSALNGGKGEQGAEPQSGVTSPDRSEGELAVE